jgi:hypothetical protein
MTTYTIETGIPLPESDSRGLGGAARKPQTEWTKTLDQLQPGQSTLTPEIKDWKSAQQFKVRRPERKYAIRKVAGQGWRVWRTE